MQKATRYFLAKKELDWSPKVNLDEGLIKTIDFFKSII
jgi:UDP-glucuronate decarboxylase